MPLDEFLPDYDFREVHSLAVAAPPELVIETALRLTWRDVPLFAALMAVRSVPALLAGHRPSASHAIVDDFRRAGFVALAERPDELVFGAVGRFWKPTGGLRRLGPADFAPSASRASRRPRSTSRPCRTCGTPHGSQRRHAYWPQTPLRACPFCVTGA